jgi:hypothetical protein
MTTQSQVGRYIRFGLVAVTLVGIALALRDATSDSGEVSWPSWREVIFAFVLLAITLAFATCGWLALFPSQTRRMELARGFVYSQLGKYVPGGVVQIAHLWHQSRQAGVQRRSIAVAMPVYAMCLTVAPGGLATAAFAMVASDLRPEIRVGLAALGLASATIAVARGAIALLFDSLHGKWSRIPSGESVPPQRAILATFGFGLATSVSFGTSFAILLDVSGRDATAAALGFVVAFTAGFLALPFPSGIGIREVVMVGLLVDIAPAVDVLSAAVAVRVVQLIAELAASGTLLAAGLLHRVRDDHSGDPAAARTPGRDDHR